MERSINAWSDCWMADIKIMKTHSLWKTPCRIPTVILLSYFLLQLLSSLFRTSSLQHIPHDDCNSIHLCCQARKLSKKFCNLMTLTFDLKTWPRHFGHESETNRMTEWWCQNYIRGVTNTRNSLDFLMSLNWGQRSQF